MENVGLMIRRDWIKKGFVKENIPEVLSAKEQSKPSNRRI